MYWDLGKEISNQLANSNWGSKVIEQVAIDLKHEFPEIKGFSRRNLYAIKQWYQFYAQQFDFVPQLVAQLPWGYNRLIVSKIKEVPGAYTGRTPGIKITKAIFYTSPLAEIKRKKN